MYRIIGSRAFFILMKQIKQALLSKQKTYIQKHIDYCICVKRITLCNCMCSSPPSSREFASVIRNIGKFGAKNS